MPTPSSLGNAEKAASVRNPPSSGPRCAFRSPRSAVAALVTGHFVHDVFQAFYAPLIPWLRERLGIGFAMAGLLGAVQQAPSVAQPLLGWLADRRGLRAMVVAGPTVTATAMTLLGFAPSAGVVAGLLFACGVGSALWHVPSPVLVARATPRAMGLGMSLFMVAGEAARSAGPIVVLAALGALGASGLPLLAPAGLAASLFLALAVRVEADPRPLRARPLPGGARLPAGLGHLLARLALLLTARAFLLAAAATFLPAFVVERGGSLWLGGAALALVQGAGAVGALTSGPLSDRIGRRRTLLLAISLAPPAMVAAALAPVSWLVPILVVLGLGAFATNPVMLALVQEAAGDRPAFANGLYMALSFGIRSGVLVLVGALADAVGLQKAFLLAGGVALVGLPAAWSLPRPRAALRRGGTPLS